MEYKDYYKIMGLERDASQDEIKRTYRKLARKYHPDVSKEPDAEAKFKDIVEAYEVLKDPAKREAYNRLDPHMASRQDFQPPPDWDTFFQFRGDGFSDVSGRGFSDFFETLFGHSAYQSQFSEHGQNQHARFFVDLEDVFHGATRSFTLQSQEIDERGRVRVSNRTLKVKIPKGLKAGQQLKLKGQGAATMHQGLKGDLYLEIHFNAHPYYRPEGRDLHMQLPVTPWEAALGGLVKVPTPDGTVRVKIPEGSNSGSKLRLKGRGIPGNPAGNIYVTLTVVVPPANNEQAKGLYKEMAATLEFNPRAGLGV